MNRHVRRSTRRWRSLVAAVATAASCAAIATVGHVAHAATTKPPAPSEAAPAPVEQKPANGSYTTQGTSVAAPTPSSASNTPVAATGAPWQPVGPKPIAGEFGPGGSVYGNASGRVTALAAASSNPSVVYLGSAGGGVWKSTNSGATWAPTSDSQASLSIGALALGDTAGQVVYAATGEDNRSTSQYGQGILKSTTGGASWTLLGQATFAGAHIGGLAVDRTTSGSTQRVLAATDVGLYASTDGGTTWTKNTQMLSAALKFNSNSTPSGAITEVKQDPATPTRFYGAVSDFCNTEAGNIIVSNDSGATWTDVNTFPNEPPGARIALGLGADGVAYASFAKCDGSFGEIDKSTNSGATWTAVTGSPGNYFSDTLTSTSGGQGDYDTAIGVDPTNSAHVLFAGLTTVATSDGGGTFTDVGKVYSGGVIHSDFHAVAFTASNSAYIGNDGGVWKTTDLGGTGSASDWTNLNATLQLTEYSGGTAIVASQPFGGAQDNGVAGNFGAQANDPALPAFGFYASGDGAHTAVDPTAGSHTIYMDTQFLNLLRDDYVTNDLSLAGPCDHGSAPACSDPTEFAAPFALDQVTPSRLLAGTNRVWQSTSSGLPAGSGWSAISPDLTTGNTFGAGRDALAVIAAGSTAATHNTVFTGSQYGRVYRTTNGTTWTNITGNLPQATSSTYFFPLAWVSGIAFNPANADEAWVTIGAPTGGHLWHTTNASAGSGTTWTDLSGAGGSALPTAPALSVRVDPHAPATVYVGTYYGVEVCTTCGGASPSPAWSSLGTGLPNTPVSDLSITEDGSTLMAWTKGRGLWSLSLSAAVPDLLISASHTGNFSQGETGATFTIVATNEGSAPTTGTVTATDALPTGLTATAMTGNGWTCQAPPTLSCSRSEALAPGLSYPPITVTVSVAGNAAPTVTNTAAVSGGGEANTTNDTATDQVNVLGGTIVYVLNNNVWMSSPDGRTQQQLTHDGVASNITGTQDCESGPYCFPSITDDGSLVVAFRNQSINGITQGVFYEMDRQGNLVRPAVVPPQPVDNTCFFALGFSRGAVSPDGTKLAFVAESVSKNVSGCPQNTFAFSTFVTNIDGSSEVGMSSNASEPSWFGSSQLLFATGAAPASVSYQSATGGSPTQYFSDSFDLAYDPDARTGRVATMDRSHLNLWSDQSGTVTRRCAYTNGDGNDNFAYPHWSPDTQAVAYGVQDSYSGGTTATGTGVWVLFTGDITSGCSAASSAIKIADKGVQPFWGGGSVGATTPTGNPYHPLTPTRILDTRPGQFHTPQNGPTTLGAYSDVAFKVTGTFGSVTVPDTATAVVMNVAEVNGSQPGNLTLYPTGQPIPNTANANWAAGQTVSNLVEVAIGTGGQVSVHNASGAPADVVYDLAGYVGPGTTTSGQYVPVVPARLADTRTGTGGTTGPMTSGTPLVLQATGAAGLPASGVSAVVMNVTVTGQSGDGDLTIYPDGTTQPNVANLNYRAGEDIGNRVVVPISAAGKLDINNYTPSGSTQIIADVVGYFTDATAAAGAGTTFTGITPNRIADTRSGQFHIGPNNTLGTSGQITVQVTGTPGVPAGAKGVVLNVAVTNTSAPSDLRVWPADAPITNTADINWLPGVTRSNLVPVKLSAGGAVNIENDQGNVDVIVDVLGYYS